MSTTFAATLQSYFTSYLIGQRAVSDHTITAYKHTWRMLLGWVHHTMGIPPSQVDFDILDVEAVTGFLEYLKTRRGNSARTRNARLAAIHSMFGYAAYRHPDHAHTIARVLAVRTTHTHREVLNWLTAHEVDALLAAPDHTRRLGRRDHAMMQTLATTGLRVGELTGLTHANLHLTSPAYLQVHGKGRKDRITPLDPTTTDTLQHWTAEFPAADAESAVFSGQGHTSPISTDAVATRISVHAAVAAECCHSLKAKHVTPHVLRHSFAMKLRAQGIDVTTIALWMGHESPQSCQAYLHADLGLKQRVLDRLATPGPAADPYTPNDELLAFLEGL